MTEKLEQKEQGDNHLRIRYWFCKRQENARWMTESVRVPLTKRQARGLSLFMRVTDTQADAKPELIQNVPKDRDEGRMATYVYENVIYIHGVYRAKLDRDQKARKQIWFRGARIKQG